MVLTASTIRRGWGVVSIVALALVAGVGIGISAQNDPPLVFGSDAGVVLTFVVPEKTAEFEQILDRFRGLLEESEDPIRRQQAGNWIVYRSPDPGPANSVLYVSFIEPVLKGANYNIADIMAEELSENEAEILLATLEASLSQSQSQLSLKSVLNFADDIPPELTEETGAAP